MTQRNDPLQSGALGVRRVGPLTSPHADRLARGRGSEAPDEAGVPMDFPSRPDVRYRLVSLSAYLVVALCLAAALLLVLRIAGVIGWSWWRVLAPVWVPAGALLATLVLIIFAGALADIGASRRLPKDRRLSGR